MRKKKRKLSNLLMVLLLLFAFYYLYDELSGIKTTAVKLVNEFTADIIKANKKYLDKELEISGTFEAYYEFKNESNLMELNSGNSDTGIYCIISSEEQNKFIKKLTTGMNVTVNGICLGLIDNKFPKSVYIKMKNIK